MPAIMCARRLWTLIGGRGPLPERHAGGAPQLKLGAWSAQDVDTDAGHLVVALEEFTYLTVVFHVVPVSGFLDHLSAAVGLALSDLGVPLDVANAEAQAIALGGTFARNNNRSLLGSVTDVTFHAAWLLEGARWGDVDAIRLVQRNLNDLPHVDRTPSFPSAALRRLLDSPHPIP